MTTATTTTMNDKTIEGLQNLIEVNLDSGNGFETVAENIENKDIAAYFRRCGQRRQSFASELQSYVRANGEEPKDSGSMKGKLHRWWTDLRGSVQSGDEHAMLAEAERGEDVIKHTYEDVLKETAGSPLNSLLQQQWLSVKQDHDLIRDMRDARA